MQCDEGLGGADLNVLVCGHARGGRRQVAKASGTREMDTLFHTRIGKLESAVDDAKAQVTLELHATLDGARGEGLRGLDGALGGLATRQGRISSHAACVRAPRHCGSAAGRVCRTTPFP